MIALYLSGLAVAQAPLATPGVEALALALCPDAEEIWGDGQDHEIVGAVCHGWFDVQRGSLNVELVSERGAPTATRAGDATLALQATADRVFIEELGFDPEELGNPFARELMRVSDADETPLVLLRKTFVDRVYQGVPVAGSRLVVTHSPDGSVCSVKGTWPAIPEQVVRDERPSVVSEDLIDDVSAGGSIPVVVEDVVLLDGVMDGTATGARLVTEVRQLRGSESGDKIKASIATLEVAP